VVSFLNNNSIVAIFIITALGYILGRIKIKNISLGTAGILIVALIFGHVGVEMSAFLQSLGLVCFVTSVGFIAGPQFFNNFRGNAIAYIILGIIIVSTGSICCLAIVKITSLGIDLALGLMAGALTTTPGLAAAIESTGSDMVSVGYGIAYPFGVIGVVLFVQLVPSVLKVDIVEERERIRAINVVGTVGNEFKLVSCDSRGFFGFSLAIVLGILIGRISIPLPGGVSFSLGTSGGPLIAGLILGYVGHIGKLNVSVKSEVLVTMREFGLAMFLVSAGCNAGVGFVSVISEQGIILFVYGMIMTLVPLITGYLVATKVFRMELFNMLGAICGGMTSTPALGTLINVAGTDDVVAAYAATYPVALAMVVLLTQMLGAYL
jgi:putative transport protein